MKGKLSHSIQTIISNSYIYHIFIYDVTVSSVIWSACQFKSKFKSVLCVFNKIYIILYCSHLQFIQITVFILPPVI